MGLFGSIKGALNGLNQMRTSPITTTQLELMEFFAKLKEAFARGEHKELAPTLVNLHEAWREDFHHFEHTTRDHFMEICTEEDIDEDQANGWFVEWRKERLLLEEDLLPLFKAGIEKVVPVKVVITAFENMKTESRDQLDRFFFEEWFALHQSFAFETMGAIQERFEKVTELASIKYGYQKALEDLVFKIESSEGRLFMVRWAKNLYDSLVDNVIVLIEQDNLQEKIERDTLNEFRALKSHNLETLLLDSRSYAKAREQLVKQWFSLVFRMRQELVKKAINE